MDAYFGVVPDPKLGFETAERRSFLGLFGQLQRRCGEYRGDGAGLGPTDDFAG